MCCCVQLIDEKVAHAYECVCVVAGDWSECGLCICMCVLCQLISKKVTRAYAYVCVVGS